MRRHSLPRQTGRIPIRTATLLLPLALLAASSLSPLCAASVSEREIKNFRKGLEDHFSGNLPRLIEYLKTVDGATALADGSPPAAGSVPEWTPEPVTETVCYDSFDAEVECGSPEAARVEEREHERTSTVYSAGQVRQIQRKLVERELWRILEQSEAGPAADPGTTLAELDELVSTTEIDDGIGSALDTRTQAERTSPSQAEDPGTLDEYGEFAGGPEDLDGYLDGLSEWIGEQTDEWAAQNPDTGGAQVSEG